MLWATQIKIAEIQTLARVPALPLIQKRASPRFKVPSSAVFHPAKVQVHQNQLIKRSEVGIKPWPTFSTLPAKHGQIVKTNLRHGAMLNQNIGPCSDPGFRALH